MNSTNTSYSFPILKLKSPKDILFENIPFRTPLVQVIVDSPWFQRCRFINQLQCTPLVYPSAQHTRFAHQLQTYHCTNLWLDHLLEQQPELKQECIPRIKELIGLGALLHDIG